MFTIDEINQKIGDSFDRLIELSNRSCQRILIVEKSTIDLFD